MDHKATTTPPTLPSLFYKRNGITIPLADVDLETKLPNSIKIYRDKKANIQITSFVNEYSLIWKSLEFVQVPPKQWMKIHLKPGWESKISAIKPKVYP